MLSFTIQLILSNCSSNYEKNEIMYDFHQSFDEMYTNEIF